MSDRFIYALATNRSDRTSLWEPIIAMIINTALIVASSCVCVLSFPLHVHQPTPRTECKWSRAATRAESHAKSIQFDSDCTSRPATLYRMTTSHANFCFAFFPFFIWYTHTRSIKVQIIYCLSIDRQTHIIVMQFAGTTNRNDLNRCIDMMLSVFARWSIGNQLKYGNICDLRFVVVFDTCRNGRN